MHWLMFTSNWKSDEYSQTAGREHWSSEARMTSLLHVRPHISKLSPVGRIQTRSVSLQLSGQKAAKKNKPKSPSASSAGPSLAQRLSARLSGKLSVLGVAGRLGPEYVLDKRLPGVENIRSRRTAALVKHLKPESTKNTLASLVKPLAYSLADIMRQVEQKKLVGKGRRMKKHTTVHVRRGDSVLPSDSDKPVKVSGPYFSGISRYGSNTIALTNGNSIRPLTMVCTLLRLPPIRVASTELFNL